jgi:hypothetical protein
MQTLRVDLILVVVMGAAFLNRRKTGVEKRFSHRVLQNGTSLRLWVLQNGTFRQVFLLFWRWADYRPKDWSSAV